MIKAIFRVLFFLLAGSVLALAQKNYHAIDQRAMEVPNSESVSINRLASYLTATSKNDLEKARAIYVWVTHHIIYGDSTVTNGWLGTSENAKLQQAENVLKNRNAVCEGFANLYKALCEAAGLQAEVVTGIVKDEDGVVADVAHAWNAVHLGGQWYLTDPTWGSGYADYWSKKFKQEFQESFFLIPAEKMVQDHLPDDPIWQLLPNPLTEAEFRTLSAGAMDSRSAASARFKFNFRDSIALWFRQDSSQRIVASSERILQFNPNNSLALARLGSHFCNLSLSLYAHVEENILSALDDNEHSLDTMQLLNKLTQGEYYVQKSWSYYHQVNDSKLKAQMETLPTEKALLAEFTYLRGLLCTWRTIAKAQQLNDFQDNIPMGYLEAIHAEAEQARDYFANAQKGYKEYSGEIYEQSVIKAQLHEALLYNYLAKADAFCNGKWHDKGEKQLESNLAALDRSEKEYNKMYAIVKEVLKKVPNSIMGISLANDYPLGMASLASDRGFVYLALLNSKYATQWDRPELINSTTAPIMISDYKKCDVYCEQGFTLLKQCNKNKQSEEISIDLRALRGSIYASLGDIKARFVVTEVNNIKTLSEFKSRKTALLRSIDEAIDHYQNAIALLGGDENVKSILIASMDKIKTTRQHLLQY